METDILASTTGEGNEMANPITTPTAQVIGNNENACATLVSSVTSAIMLFTTPMFPLNAPCRHRLAMKTSHTSQLNVDTRQRVRTGGGLVVPEDESQERAREAKCEDRSYRTSKA